MKESIDRPSAGGSAVSCCAWSECEMICGMSESSSRPDVKLRGKF